MKIALAHFRVGETDGVSLEMDKWKWALEQLGHECIFIAGSEGKSKAVVIEEIHYQGEMNNRFVRNLYQTLEDYASPQALEDAIMDYAKIIEDKLVYIIQEEKIDLIIPNNIWSLGWHVPAGIGFAKACERTNIRWIAHHHDFHWERVLYANPCCAFMDKIKAKYFPPTSSQIKHCVINRIAQGELKQRYGLEATVVPNVFDFKASPWKEDAYNQDFRAQFRLNKNDLVFLQATRITERKGIELGIDLLATFAAQRSELEGKTLYNGEIFTSESKIVYLWSGMNEADAYFAKLNAKAKKLGVEIIYAGDRVDHSRSLSSKNQKIYSLWDTYVASDFVLYPSLLEGWGNQFLEGIFAGKAQVIYEYPVYEKDLKTYCFDVVSLGNKHQIDQNNLAWVDSAVLALASQNMQDILLHPSLYQKMAQHNFAVAAKHFSYEALQEIVEKLV